MYADALLLVAGLPVEHRPANAEADLETLLKAVPNALSAASANELLWLLGVPAMRRDQVRALVERRALATHAAEAVVAALRVADSDRETAQKLLKAARAKLGFVVP
jgi:hypothetical protein